MIVIYAFGFKGGAFRNDVGVQEKFLLLAVVNKKEIFLHQAIRAGIVTELYSDASLHLARVVGIDGSDDGTKDTMHVPLFTTEIKTWKLFMSISGFGVPRRYYSLFFDLMPTEVVAPTVRVCALSTELTFANKAINVFRAAGFAAKCRLIARDRIEELLSGDSISMLKQSPPMPLAFAKQIIQVDRTSILTSVRQVRFRRKEA